MKSNNIIKSKTYDSSSKGSTDIDTAALIVAQCDGGGVDLTIVFRG